MFRPLTLAAAIALVASGCVTTNVTPLTAETYTPVDPASVVLYLSEDDIPGDYAKVALIYAKGESSWTNEQQMFEKVRKDAAKLGANGVLIQNVDEPSAGAKIAGAFLGTGSSRSGEMIAIYVFPDDSEDG